MCIVHLWVKLDKQLIVEGDSYCYMCQRCGSVITVFSGPGGDYQHIVPPERVKKSIGTDVFNRHLKEIEHADDVHLGPESILPLLVALYSLVIITASLFILLV